MSAPVVIANPRRTRWAAEFPQNAVTAQPTDNAPVSPAGQSAQGVDPKSGHVRNRLLRAVLVISIIALGVILWGGYTQGWEWTGVSEKDTLWHWMQLLMVPIAFAALPGVLRDHRTMHLERKLLMLASMLFFVGFIIVSYLAPWDWTGFTGNTLWDWLSLLLLPIAITSVRFLRAERTLTWAHFASAAVFLAGFGVLILFGYIEPWDWTGFAGNTVLDWVQLLILPILFPTVVVPAAAAWLTAKREGAEADRVERVSRKDSH
jgi:hypothetical protein